MTTTSFARPLSPSIDEQQFKQAMRHLAGAVSVITVGHGEERTGFTATSVTSFSAEPPSILVCLNRSSSSWPALQRHGSFCVNVLSHEQRHVAERFAGAKGARGIARYEGALWQPLVTGALALSDALTVIDCELDEAIDRHSHSIIIGRVRAVVSRPNTQPLIYWHGAYRELTPPPHAAG